MTNRLTPTFVAQSIETLDVSRFIAELAKRGITAVSYDLDDTLTGYYATELSQAALAVISALYKAGIEQMIISNAGRGRHERVKAIAKEIAEATGMPFFAVTSYEIGARKPSSRPYVAAAKLAHVTPSKICHVGDQLPRDILGANRAKFGATLWLAHPIGVTPNWITQHVQRAFERRMLTRFTSATALDRDLSNE